MSKKTEELKKTIGLIENQFKRAGLWQRPYVDPPQIKVREEWDEDIQDAAEVLNRVFMVRALPDCSRLFGPVRESSCEAFLHDYTTKMEKVNYARSQVNLLVMDIAMISGIDRGAISKVDE